MLRKTDRLGYIDIFRGIGICLMVMGHIGFGDIFQHFIHAFHMPMFFFVSGFFYKRSIEPPTIVLIKRKAKKLLLPYLICGIFHYFISFVIYEERTLEPIKHLLFINTEGLPIAGAIWFLTALFIVNVLYLILDKYIRHIVLKNIIVIILSIMGNMWTRVFLFRLPFACDVALVGLGLYHIGYLFYVFINSSYVKRILNLPLVPLTICTMITIFSIFINGSVNMRKGVYENILLFWINSILSIIVGINYSKIIEKVNILRSILINIGKNSMIYVCFNEICILMAQAVLTNISMPIRLKQICILVIVIEVLRFFDDLSKKIKKEFMRSY